MTNAVMRLFFLLCITNSVCMSGAAAQMPTDECRRTLLKSPPKWAITGAFRYGESQVVFADSSDDVLRAYNFKGRLMPHSGPASANTVGRIQGKGDGFLLQDRSGVFVDLAPNYDGIENGRYRVKGVKGKDGYKIGTINNWAYVEDADTLLAFGYLENASGTWIAGFLAIPLKAADAFTIIKAMDPKDRSLYMYLMGLQMIAANRSGDSGYILSMESSVPEILVVNASARSLEAKYQLSTALAHTSIEKGLALDNTASAAAQFKTLELSTLPVGLYSGKEEAVFILLRSPLPEGETEWSLIRLDASGSFRGSHPIILPTRTNHITVVPGEKYWAILEKGEVEDFAVQEIPSLLLIPASWIESEESWERPLKISPESCN